VLITKGTFAALIPQLARQVGVFEVRDTPTRQTDIRIIETPTRLPVMMIEGKGHGIDAREILTVEKMRLHRERLKVRMLFTSSPRHKLRRPGGTQQARVDTYSEILWDKVDE
jgi:hypothetical protein